MLMIK
jgi:hypothetical protein